MTNDELLERFDVTADQLDQWERDASRGKLPGSPAGKVMVGRPLKFGERTRQIGFKEPLHVVQAIDDRARQLKLARSDYLRSLVEKDLRSAGLL